MYKVVRSKYKLKNYKFKNYLVMLRNRHSGKR